MRRQTLLSTLSKTSRVMKMMVMMAIVMTVILQSPTGTEATCSSCNERLKTSLICCIFDGRCCVLGPVAVGKRDLSWVQQRYKERQEEEEEREEEKDNALEKLHSSDLDWKDSPVHNSVPVLHPLARPRD